VFLQKTRYDHQKEGQKLAKQRDIPNQQAMHVEI
jgi:hypothetical protein